jgi:Ca2+-binding EF-hand superfamily protein
LRLDSDSSGSLGPDEIKEAFKNSGVTDEDLVKMFDEVDFNHDGEINYSEFMVAFARKEVTKDANHLEAVFKHFSNDSDFITP